MTRKISTFIFIGLIFTVIAWMLDKNGIVIITWRGERGIFSVPEFMLLVLLFVAVIDFLNRILRRLVNLQMKEAYKNTMQNLNESEAIDVLAGKISEKIVIDRKDFDNAFLLVLRAMTSVTAGDMQAARRHLKALRKIIGNDPIIDVLTMKIYKGEKDFDKMEKLSAKLMKNEDIQIVGMKAAVEAQMEKREFSEALRTANKAFELRQDLYWVIESAFELRAKAQDWDGALQVLDAGHKKKLVPEDRYKRLKAIVLYEMAKEYKAKGDDVNFFKCASQSIAADETLVPAALIMSEYLVANDNQYRKAAKVLTNAWKKNPVDELAYAYLDLWPEEEILDRIQRMESFAMLNAKRPSLNNRIMAELCAQAGLWGKAEGEIEIFLINNPATKKICEIAAKYEKYYKKDKEAAAEWQKKCPNCADDSQWVCNNCGYKSAEWHSVCPECTAFGQNMWHLYVEKEEPEVEETHETEEEEE